MYARLPWYAWPLAGMMEILHHFFFVVLHFMGTILGLTLIGIGLLLTGTIIGAILGIPLIFSGIFIRYRCKFEQ
ncbi:MAG: hypothetical protein ABFD24_05630 [Anaerolineaceae bacterium]|jgi:hypothetical protein